MHDTPPSYTRRCTTDCAYVTDGNKILKTQLVLFLRFRVFAWANKIEVQTKAEAEACFTSCCPLRPFSVLALKMS